MLQSRLGKIYKLPRDMSKVNKVIRGVTLFSCSFYFIQSLFGISYFKEKEKTQCMM